MTYVAAVLTGGASRRMGVDKATLLVDGIPMAQRVEEALRQAGADEVVMVGRAVGDEPAIADRYPGEGPLGGVLTALAWSAPRTVLVAPCDLVAPDPRTFAALIEGLDGAGAVAAVGGAADPLPLALRPEAADPLTSAFDEGERSLQRAVARLAPVVVGLSPSALADADTRDELPPGAR